ncbi:spore germination protein [Paenibacillus sp. LMG 31456]|uniref:Spore germination protein n=1 Tax=Paenibacillus foliorum TaxID=2654974 RepID=A0A972GU28_9BACL|nr:spore germination protein [Paenibacillus foliorum]NOU93842.1 spore germination protein [Paenibacillus foliorum]
MTNDTSHPRQPIGNLSSQLEQNLIEVKQALGKSGDLIIREFTFDPDFRFSAAVVYIDGLTDQKSIQQFILEPLMLYDLSRYWAAGEQGELLDIIHKEILLIGDIKTAGSYKQLYEFILSGNVLLLVDGISSALSLGLSKSEHRSITEPTNEVVIRGPKEAFTENIRTNTSLIRKRLRNPNLRIEERTIGIDTQTKLALVYVEGIIQDEVLEEVRARLDGIHLDKVLDSSYVEEFLEEKHYSPFPRVFNTERPDVVAATLLEGRFAIIVDGTPFVLTAPSLFMEYFQSSDDYYQRWNIATLIRVLRYTGLFIALLGPSLYIAITTYQHEMLPAELLFSLASQREGVPFPAFIEAFLMEVSFEILREAGLRMPRGIGQTVSIVGTLVIGQSAVEAGIVSGAMVVVVAITAISSFIIPSYTFSSSVRMLRFSFMFLSASFGLYGIMVGLFALVLHLSSLSSFGVPYMSSFGPMIWRNQQDLLYRAPISSQQQNTTDKNKVQR